MNTVYNLYIKINAAYVNELSEERRLIHLSTLKKKGIDYFELIGDARQPSYSR